jgi:GH15 family glucan-1,4-alpha-glucosidase
MPHYKIRVSFVFAFTLLLSQKGITQNTSLPIMEMIFGPTATNAVVGNGGLTVGLSKYGEVVNLRWPCSNYYDQLNFATIHPVPAYNKVEWYGRHLDTKEFMGSYTGIGFAKNGKQIISWFRDKDWMATQSYLYNDAPIVVTKYENEKLGIVVSSTDFVLPNTDVYCRSFKLEKNNNNITDLQLYNMSNMAVCNTLKPNDPNSDWANDSKNGYVSFLDKQNDASISFILNEQSSKFKTLPNKNNTDAFIDAVKTNYIIDETTIDKQTPNLDVFCAIGSNKKSVTNYLYKSNDFTINKPSNNDFVNGNSITLSSYTLPQNESINFYFSLAGSYKNCITQLENVKKKTTEEIITETKLYWQQKIAKATLPKVPDGKMKITLQRILINTLLATNKGNGIGSSVGETQPPYTMIWVRDAAIMGYMLDCAGYTKEAEDNVNFIVNTQRKTEGQDCKKPNEKECYKGSWSQCYFANGTPSWDYDFEVDEVGWGIWAMYSHSLFLPKEKQKAYLNKVRDNVKMAADFLVMFKDKNGLQKKAREDDLLWKSQTSLGAATTLIGLKSAIAVLTILNPADEKIKIYQQRKDELETAIVKEFWSEKRKEFEQKGYGNFGPRGLIIWPAQFLPIVNDKIQNHSKSILGQIDIFFNKDKTAMNKEWWYLGKATTALAYAANSVEDKKLVENYLKILLTDVCTQDTYIYGETPMLRKNDNGNLYYDNRVGQPSNHPAAWIYMTAELLYGNTHPELYKLIY